MREVCGSAWAQDVILCVHEQGWSRQLSILSLTANFGLRHQGKSKGKANTQTSDDTGHILGILSSLFSNLASDSVPRIRLLSKFADSEYEKVDRLLEIRESVITRLRITDREIAAAKAEAAEEGEDDEDNADMWELRRMDGGLFTLQTVDYLLGWICMEDDGVSSSRIDCVVGSILFDACLFICALPDSRACPIHASTEKYVPQGYRQNSTRLPRQYWGRGISRTAIGYRRTGHAGCSDTTCDITGTDRFFGQLLSLPSPYTSSGYRVYIIVVTFYQIGSQFYSQTN